ncbi:MAG: hypothetical protein ACRD3M_08295 [Thermoanaerobaculia bacterium]
MKKRKPKRRRPAAASVRLPLPKKGEARHGDRTKYDRAREKERLRRERPAPEGGG